MRSIECRVASSDDLADDRVIDAIGPDLDLAVVAAHRLRDERKPEDADPRVEAQVCGGAHAPGQAVFGVDGRPEVGADGADDHRGQGRDRRRSAAFAPATFWPTAAARSGSARLIEQVARYR